MTATTSDVSTEVHDDADGAHAHPSDKTYVKVALLLAVFTAAEVATYPLEDTLGNGVVITVLLVLMTIKFWYVASFFMHLKFDSKIFSWVFVAGIVTALFCYVVLLSTFEFWAGA